MNKRFTCFSIGVRVVLVSCLVFWGAFSSSAQTYYWIGNTGSGDLTSGTLWSLSLGGAAVGGTLVPSQATTYIINGTDMNGTGTGAGGTTATINLGAARIVSQFHIINGASALTITMSGTSLQVGQTAVGTPSTTGDDLYIAPNCTLTLNTTLTLANATNAVKNNANIAGVVNIGSGTGRLLNLAQSNNAATPSVITGTIAQAGTSTSSGLQVEGSLTIDGTVTIAHTRIFGTSPLITVNGLLSYTGASTVTNAGLVVNAGGEVRFGNTISTFATMTISGMLTIGGSISSTPTTTAVSYSGTSSTLRYTTTSSITSNGEWPASNQPYNVTIAAGASSNITMGGAASTKTIPGVLTMGSGRLYFNASGNTLVLNGTVTGMSATSYIRGNTNSGTRLTIGGTGPLGTLFFDQGSSTTRTIGTFTVNRTGGSGTVGIGNALDATTLVMQEGQIILGTGDLLVGATTGSNAFNTGNMVVTSATSGRVKKNFLIFSSPAQTFTYPIGEIVGTPEYCGFTLTLNSNGSFLREIGFKVVDACHANIGSVSHHLSRYYSSSLSESAGTYSYSMSLPYDDNTSAATVCPTATPGDAVGAVIGTVESSIGIAGYNGTAWVGYPGTVSSGLLAVTGNELTAPLAMVDNGVIDITGTKVANDDACGAVTLTAGTAGQTTCGTSSNGTVSGATQSLNSSACLSPGGTQRDVWYKFVATASSHTVMVSTPSTSFDPVVQSHTAQVACASIGLTPGDCENSQGAGATEKLQMNGLTIGNTYHVRVYHSNSFTPPADGRFTICVLTAPSNDEICGAIALDPNVAPSNTPGDVALASPTSGFNSTACLTFSPQNDVWYKFVAENTTETIQVVPSGSLNPIIQFHSSGGSPLCSNVTLTPTQCENDFGTGTTENLMLTGLTIGSTYYFRVYHASATVPATTSFTVSVISPCITYSGIVKIGPNVGDDFPSLTEALAYFASCPYSGHIVLELQTGYVSTVETFPVTFSAALGSDASRTLTVRPATGLTGVTITSTNAISTVDLSAPYIRLDGRPGGTGTAKELIIANTTTGVPALRFINGAQNDNVVYCVIRSANTTSTSATVLFSTSSTIANSFNLIDNCDIGNTTATAANAIYSNGTFLQENSDNTISNNNIFNYTNTGIVLAGSNNGSNWTISGNSFYSTVSASTAQTGINLTTSGEGGHVISGNYIGGNAPLAAGTWTNSGAVTFTGMNIGSITTIDITNNIIRNITTTSTSTSTSNRFIGITISSTGDKIITGNEISNITSSSGSAGSVASACMIGITCDNDMTLRSNSIHSFSNINTTAAVKMIAIYGAPTPLAYVEKNFIHSLGTSTSSTTSEITGIYIAGSGTCHIRNNMMRLGIKADGSSVNTGIITGIEKSTATVVNVIHNSIYIGGTATGASSSIYRRTSSSTSIPEEVKNNIFWNARTGGSGKNYTITLNNNTNFASDYNDLYVTGANGHIGFLTSDQTTLATWRTNTSQDASSISNDPKFIQPLGVASGVDLHIQAPPVTTTIESAGVDLGIVDDFDSETRASFSPTDIGADAGNFAGIDLAAPIITYTGITAACHDATTASLTNVSITDVSGVNVTAGTAPRVYYKLSGHANALPATNDNTTDGWKYEESTTGSSPFSFTLDFNRLFGGVVTPGDAVQYFVVAQDEGPNVGTPNVAINAGTFAALQTSVDLAGSAFPIGGSPNTLAIVPCSGTVNVGTGTYTAFTTAAPGGIFQALNIASAAGIINGNITINVTANITIENGLHGLNEIASPYTVTIQSSAAANRDISSAAGYAGALFRLNGADRVTFNGGSGTDRFLTFRNTNVSTSAATFQFLNGATNNKINNCIIESGSTSTSSGAIHFATDVVTTTGNDDNIIDNCDIRDLTTTNANFNTGIYSNGTASKENSGNTVSNCNIYNFYGSSTVAGISLGTNNTQWTIDGNRFFQKARTSAGINANFYGILISTTTGSGFNITDNVIGYETAAGTGIFGIPSTTTARFNCIYLTAAASGTINNITGNTISNISLNTTSGGGSGTPVFSGIYVAVGKYLIDGNTIGSMTGASSIALSSSSAISTSDYIAGIYTATTASGQTISNNNIGGMTLTMANLGGYLHGIRITTGSVTVSGNTIGGASVTNSMQISSTATTAVESVAGISSTSGAAYTVTIDGNTIQNLTTTVGTTSSGNPQVGGILTSGGGQFSITGNTVRSLSTNAASTGTATTASVVGISMNTSNTSALTISGNSVYNLSNTASTANNVHVEGIFFSGGTNTSSAVSKNLVYNLTSLATGTTANTFGIHLNGGAVTASNNMVRLGFNSLGNPVTTSQLITGISKDGSTGNNIYYNSVYIGGNVTGTLATYAFRRVSTATDAVRNNIFYNARTNSSSGKSYAVHLSSSTGLSQDNNIIYNVGAGTVFGGVSTTDYASMTLWRGATPFDDNSVSADPQFMDATGATPNLNLNPAVATPAESGGVVIAGLTDDFGALNVRTGYPQTQLNGGGTAPDIGADENDLIPIDVTAPTFSYTNIPTQALCAPVITTVSVTVTDAQSGISLTSNKPRMYFRRSSPSSAWDANQFVEGVNTSGNANSSVWSFTVDYAAFGITPASSNTFEYYFVAQDQETTPNVGYSQSNGATPVHNPDVAGSGTLTLPNFAFGATGVYAFGSPLSGPVTVGSGGTYATFNGASGLFAAINANGLNGDLTVSVISSISETSFTPLNAHTEHCGGPYTITVQPATNTDYVISGNNGQAMLNFYGARRVIIDGNHSGNKRLIFRDVNSTQQQVFWFNMGANNITVRNSIIEGNNIQVDGLSQPNSGVVQIGGDLAAGGAISAITFETNNIRNRSDFAQTSTNSPWNLFYIKGIGSTTVSGITISNNNLFNFRQSAIRVQSASATTTGNNFVITGNNFYEPINYPYYQYPIWFDGLGGSYGHVISNNLIGGNALPNPGITGTWTNSKTDGEIVAIYVNADDAPNAASATSIQGNTISNISLPGTGYTNFIGIRVENGRVRIGDETGNLIGSTSALGNITTAGCGDPLEFLTAATVMEGIWTQSTEEVVIENNMIGGLSSTCSFSAVSGITHGSNTYFNYEEYEHPGGKVTIRNNQVINLRSASYFQSRILSPEGLMSIAVWSNSTDCIIEGNTIGNNAANNTVARNVRVHGIFVGPFGYNGVQGNAGGTISKNLIYGLTNTNTGDATGTISPEIYGLTVAYGNWNVNNNMIMLRNGTSSTLITNTNTVVIGILDGLLAQNSNQGANYYYNTVYISGQNPASGSGGNASYAFLRQSIDYQAIAYSSGAAINIKNNILVNDRTGIGNHRSIGNVNQFAALADDNWNAGACNYNFLANSTASVTGRWTTTDYTFANWQNVPSANYNDVNSKYAGITAGTSTASLLNPAELFTDALFGDLRLNTGNNAYTLFIENLGTPVGVSDDIDAQARDASTPDIGADEVPPSCTQPTITSTTPGSDCGTASVQLEATASAGVINWFDALTAGNQVGTGSPFNTPLISSTTTYYAEANDNGCISAARTAVVATITTPTSVTWTAGASAVGDKTDWFNAANWSCGTVPTATIDAVIPTSPTGGSYFPVVDNPANAAVKDLTIQTGASLDLDYALVGTTPQGELAVHGVLTNSNATDLGSGFLTLKAGASVTGTLTVDYLKIDGNASLAATAVVNVKKELVLRSGLFTVTNGAALNLKSDINGTAYINDFDFSPAPTGTMTGKVTIERYIPSTGSTVNIFHYIGGVTAGTAASKWSDDFGMTVIGTDGFITPLVCDPVNPRTAASSNYGGLFTYHESNVTDCYLRGWKVERNTYTVQPGRGLAARINSGVVLEETGDYHAANTTITNMSKTATNLVSYSQGYNLVANPFYAPIQWTDVATDNLAVWDGAAYVYEPVLGSYTVHNLLTGPYTINTNQAFFVRTGNSTPVASNLTFTFNADTRTRGDNAVFYRRQGYEYGLDITVESNGKTDKTILAFDERFSDAFENGYDAAKLYNDAGLPSVYTGAGSDQQSIRALPLISAATRSVPLSVLVTTTGTHTFTFDGVEDFPQTSIIWLEDLQTGAIQYLRQNDTYTFTATVGDNNDRFVLHFAPELLISTTLSDCSGNSGAITLTQRGGIEWAFRVKDANGSVVGSDVFTTTETLNQLTPGTYTLNLTHPVSGYATTLDVVVDGLQPVTAAIDAPVTTVLEGEAFTLDAFTTGSTTYTWNMGDNTTYVDLPSVTYAYMLPGLYEVMLIASNESCSAQSTVRILVNKRDTVSTGIPGVDAAGDIRIHENGDRLFISQNISRNVPTARVTVFNTLGQAIMATDVKEMAFGATYTVDVHAAAGIYYVQVELASGESVLRKVMLGEER